LKPFWHPRSTLLLAENRALAPALFLKRLLRAGHPVEMIYAGDRMMPSVRSGSTIQVEPLGDEVPRPGEVVLVEVDCVPDLLRISQVRDGRVRLHGDADPEDATLVPIDRILGRVRLPLRNSWAVHRVLKRLAIDHREALTPVRFKDGDPASSVRVKYEFQAPFYRRSQAVELSPSLISRLKDVVPEGGRVLVAGCGAGRECFGLAANGWNPVGIDFSSTMIDAARKDAVARGLDIPFHVSDLRTHDEPGGSFAAVLFTFDVYSFIPRSDVRIGILRKIGQWIAPEGVVFLSARRVQRAYDRWILTLQWGAGRFRDEWGKSHSRWISSAGGIQRSFVHVCTDSRLRAEARRAGFVMNDWQEGHALLRPHAG